MTRAIICARVVRAAPLLATATPIPHVCIHPNRHSSTRRPTAPLCRPDPRCTPWAARQRIRPHAYVSPLLTARRGDHKPLRPAISRRINAETQALVADGVLAPAHTSVTSTPVPIASPPITRADIPEQRTWPTRLGSRPSSRLAPACACALYLLRFHWGEPPSCMDSRPVKTFHSEVPTHQITITHFTIRIHYSTQLPPFLYHTLPSILDIQDPLLHYHHSTLLQT